MDLLTQLFVILVITLLFVGGTKIAFYFKNRELQLIKDAYEQKLQETRSQHESFKAGFTEDMLKQLKRAEETLQAKLNEKDDQIRALVTELETLKSWKEEMGLKLAEFKGASQSNPQMLIFKLLEHNQRLNQALTAKWVDIEKNLTDELQNSINQIKKLFAEAEALHRDGLEIISIYEARLPDETRRKIHDELGQLPGAAGKVSSIPEKTG